MLQVFHVRPWVIAGLRGAIGSASAQQLHKKREYILSPGRAGGHSLQRLCVHDTLWSCLSNPANLIQHSQCVASCFAVVMCSTVHHFSPLDIREMIHLGEL